MAIYEMQRGIPGLLWGNFYDSDSGILQDAPEKSPEGGQAIFRVKGKENEVTTKFVSATETPFGGVQIRNDLGLKKKAGDAVAYVKQGTVWVEAGEEVEVGDRAYYDPDTNTFKKTGTVDVKGFFKTNAKEGQEVVLELTATL